VALRVWGQPGSLLGWVISHVGLSVRLGHQLDGVISWMVTADELLLTLIISFSTGMALLCSAIELFFAGHGVVNLDYKLFCWNGLAPFCCWITFVLGGRGVVNPFYRLFRWKGSSSHVDLFEVIVGVT